MVQKTVRNKAICGVGLGSDGYLGSDALFKYYHIINHGVDSYTHFASLTIPTRLEILIGSGTEIL